MVWGALAGAALDAGSSYMDAESKEDSGGEINFGDIVFGNSLFAQPEQQSISNGIQKNQIIIAVGLFLLAWVVKGLVK